jgi:hypothetical protein
MTTDSKSVASETDFAAMVQEQNFFGNVAFSFNESAVKRTPFSVAAKSKKKYSQNTLWSLTREFTRFAPLGFIDLS